MKAVTDLFSLGRYLAAMQPETPADPFAGIERLDPNEPGIGASEAGRRMLVANSLRRLQEAWAHQTALETAQGKGPKKFNSIRKYLRLSQAQFAEVLGVPVKTLQHWEQGRPVPRLAMVVAELLRDFPVVRMQLIPEIRGRGGRVYYPSYPQNGDR